MHLKHEEIASAFKRYDKDGSGKIDRGEFVTFFMERQSSYYDEDLATIEQLNPGEAASVFP